MSDLMIGEVTSTSPLLVELWGGQPKPVKLRLGSYTPQVGHQVVVARIGPSLVILGQRVVV